MLTNTNDLAIELKLAIIFLFMHTNPDADYPAPTNKKNIPLGLQSLNWTGILQWSEYYKFDPLKVEAIVNCWDAKELPSLLSDNGILLRLIMTILRQKQPPIEHPEIKQ